MAARAAIWAIEHEFPMDIKTGIPEEPVARVITSVMLILGLKPDWEEFRSKMDHDLLRNIILYEPESMTQATLIRV